MDIYTVSLFGHRNLLNPLSAEERLEREIYKLLKNHGYVNFLMGRTGEFDLMAALTVHRVMKSYSRFNCSLILVLPYENKSVEQNRNSFLNLYDEIEICSESANASSILLSIMFNSLSRGPIGPNNSISPSKSTSSAIDK